MKHTAARWLVLPDCLAIVAFALLAWTHTLSSTECAGLILAVLAGRLYPRPPAPPGAPSGGLPAAPPVSGVRTLLQLPGAVLGVVARLGTLVPPAPAAPPDASPAPA